MKCKHRSTYLRLNDNSIPPPISRPLGLAYHGELDHREAERLLDGMESGCFLVRRSGSSKGYFTLSVRFNGRTKHFRLFYAKDSGQFYLKQHYKHFDSVNALVEDGLVSQSVRIKIYLQLMWFLYCSETTIWSRYMEKMDHHQGHRQVPAARNR